MKYVKTQEAAGHVLCHDLTMIIPGKFKGPAFRKGHVIKPEDIPVLLSMGKENLYVWEKQPGMLHEDEAAAILAKLCLGQGTEIAGEPKEGKIEIKASTDGLLKIDDDALTMINSIGEMMIATRHGNFPVKKGDIVAATRVIPLVIEEEKMKKAEELCEERRIATILPFHHMNAGIIVTGSEVAGGRIQDSFSPVVEKKLKEYDITVADKLIVGDDMKAIARAVTSLIEGGADVILCTGGMSVDPDDRTPGAIKSLGADIVTYGAPVLPGAMFLLAYCENEGRKIPVMGLPGCVMYAKRTIFDLILPRVIAEDVIDDISYYGQGGLCLNCSQCVFPLCGFGK